MKPRPYSFDAYVKWHDEKVEADRPIAERLRRRREELKSQARDDLECLDQLLSYMFTYAKREYKAAHGQDVNYHSHTLIVFEGQGHGFGPEYQQ